MFPNSNLEINGVTETLDSRTCKVPYTECIVEAVKICFEDNNSQLRDETFFSNSWQGDGSQKMLPPAQALLWE